MVTITNGSRTTTVTRGVFNAVYAPMGWELVGSKEETYHAEGLLNTEEKSPENANFSPEGGQAAADSWEDDSTQVEIPLSEMKIAELKAYAAEHGIDISAAKNKRDIIAIIKAEMEE